MGNITNGYSNHWWYDHTSIMKDVKLVGCDVSKQIQSDIRKWTKNKWNEGVLKRANNQPLMLDLHKSEDVLAQDPKEFC